jgi:hypothetical protein
MGAWACPPRSPQGHNTWCVNIPGSLLVIPTSPSTRRDALLLQNGYAIYDDPRP